MDSSATFTWESLPEYRYLQRFAYSLGRIFKSLPRSWRRRCERPLVRGTSLLAATITMANLDVPPGEEDLPRDVRRDASEAALEAVSVLREGVTILKDARKGSKPDLLVALDLLDRIEEAIRNNPALAA
jgi:hypothetical protein